MTDIAVDILNVIGLISSIASLVLAVVAIWLSIVFYRFSRDQAESSKANANEISNSISRLEKVFDGLYSDTFSMMKDTVTDMRKHIWRRDDSAAAGEESPPSTADAVLEKLELFSSDLGIARSKIEQLAKRLAPVVEESVEAAVARPISLRARVVRALDSERRNGNSDGLTLSQLSKRLSRRVPVDGSNLIDVIFDLRLAGRVVWDGPPNELSSDSHIRYVPRPAGEVENVDPTQSK